MSDFIFGQMGVEVQHFIQSFANPIFNLFFIIITNFGDVPFYLVVLAIIYWLVNKKTGAHLAAALIIFGYVTEVIKGFVGWIRPYLADPSQVELIGPKPSGYSFPSGHSQSTGTFWPVLVSRYPEKNIRKFLFPLAIAFIIIIPFSRVYLGVHYPGDVIFGLLFGLVGSFFYIRYNQQVINFFKQFNDTTLISLIIIISVFMTIFETEAVIIGNNSLQIAEPGILPGMFLGAFVGFLLENKYVKFNDKPSKPMFYVSRIIIGSLVVAILFIVPYFLFKLFKDDYFIIIGHFIEFACIGLGIAVVGPFAFTKFEEYITRRNNS